MRKKQRKYREYLKAAMIVLVLLLSLQIVTIPVHVAAENYNFEAGSLIIPMDVASQNMGMWKAYGLVYELLAKGVPVSWAIAPDKSFNGTDFTVAGNIDLRTGTAINYSAYAGGPFIIASSDADAAIPIIQAWWSRHNNQPNVHQTTAPFSANVDIVLRSPPRIANEATNAGIAINYYNTAGIPDLNGNPWTSSSPNILTQTQIANGGLFTRGACSQRNFDIFVTPHNGGYSYSLTDPTNLGTRTYAELDYFVHQGGGWMALCHSILSNENAIANLYNNSSASVKSMFIASGGGGFLTKKGFPSIANVGGTWTVERPELPLAQAVSNSTVQSIPGGSVKTWDRSVVDYHAETELIAHFKNLSTGKIYDWAINGVAHDGTTLGKVTFLGGHTYSTSLPYASNSQAPYLRFFYNALFFNGAAVAKLDLITSPERVPQGYDSDIIISLLNTGSSFATDPRNITITLSAGVSYVSTIIGPVPDVIDGQQLIWNTLPNIVGNTTALEIRVSVDPSLTAGINFNGADSKAVQIANFQAKYGDVYNEGFTANLCRSLDVYPAPNPVITKTPESQEYYVGQVAKWQLTYGNSGANELFNAVVEDILPAGFAFRSSIPAPLAVVPLSDGTTRIRWNVGILPANTPVVGTITLEAFIAKDPGTYVNKVRLRGTDAENLLYEVEDTAEVVVTEPPISLLKAVIPTGTTTFDEILTYSIRPSYYGSNLLSDVLIADAIPAYAHYVSASANAGGMHGFTPLPGILGVDTDPFEVNPVRSTTLSVTVSPTAVAENITVAVAITFNNDSGKQITNIVPQVVERLDGAELLSGPSLTGFSLNSGASQTVTYTFKMTEIGERRFEGSATGLVGTEEYSFSDGLSNTVLVTSHLNNSPVNDVVTWRLGSNAAAVNGETIVSGYTAGIYALRGDSKVDFSKYGIGNNQWVPKAPTFIVGQGGALTTDGTYIYALRGNTSKDFSRYDIEDNIWITRAPTPENVKWGGALTYLNGYIYAFRGDGKKDFWRYDIAANSWTAIAATPENVKEGGALTTDGTSIYALRGDGKKDFWRYNIAANNWTIMAATSQNVKQGGSLTYLNGYIYALRGDGKKDFWRYDIAANSWTATGVIASTPQNVKAGGALTTDGTYIYALRGDGKTDFWRYDIAANSWTDTGVMASTFENVKDGGALVYDPGVNPVGQFTSFSTDAGLVTSSVNTPDPDEIRVRLNITSTTPVNNITVPSDLQINGLNGASATKVSGPVLISNDNNILDINDPVIYEWVYTAQAAAIPGSVTFSFTYGSVTGADPASSPVTLPVAISRSVLVSPELTFQVRVFDAASLPETADKITNVAMISDQSALAAGIESNATNNPLVWPILTLQKSNAPAGTVRLGNTITYTLVLRNEGAGTAQNVVISDLIPQYTTYINGSATISASPPEAEDPNNPGLFIPRTLNILPPTTTDPLRFEVNYLALDETVTMTFKVKVDEGRPAGSYTIENDATATATGISPVTSNKVMNDLVVAADFVVQKIPDITLAYAGETINYIIAIINTGDVPLTITDISDPMLVLTYDSGDNNNIGMLDVNEIWYYTGSYIVPAIVPDPPNFFVEDDHGTLLRNTVSVTTGEAGTKTETADVKLAPGFSLVKSNNPVDTVRLGDEITYTLVLTNDGIGTGHDIEITDVIPQYTSYISGSASIVDNQDPVDPPRDLTVVAPESAAQLIFRISYLRPGESITIEFKVKVIDDLPSGSYTITNQAVLTADNVVPVESNIVTNTLRVSALLRISKVVEYAEGSGYSELIDADTAFTIRVRNLDEGYAADLLLKAGETVELEVPLGVYTISEVAIPVEYSLEEVLVYEDGTLLIPLQNGDYEITGELVHFTFTNRFEHITYFHGSYGVTNMFSPEHQTEP